MISDHRCLRDNVFVDNCVIKDKRLSVSLGKDSGIVRLLKVIRNSSISLFLSMVVAIWLAGIMKECQAHVS